MNFWHDIIMNIIYIAMYPTLPTDQLSCYDNYNYMQIANDSCQDVL